MEEKRKPPHSGETTPGEGGFQQWFRDFMNLRVGSDREGAVLSITNGNIMRGSNAWMLVCSIMIASLGLNLNSGAVIIGAMLISPLMNPILGVGLSVGTNDRGMLEIALKNFSIAIAIALITSSIYFYFTPLDVFTSEMRSRTEPTLLDGLIAVFGGLAGIISVTRSDKTNAIPGVAIATALMPPLCVAGYGLTVGIKSGGDFTIFWRAFYLFFLNSFFIAATAYVIIRLLRFPYRTYMTRRESRRSQIIIGLISVLMILPGYYIFRDMLNRQREARAVELFTERYFPTGASSSIFDRRNPRRPLLIFPVTDRQIPTDSLAIYSEMLQAPPYRVAGARVVVDTSFSPSEIAGIKGELASLQDINSRLQALEESEIRNERQQQQMLDAMRGYRMDSLAFVDFSQQLMLAFPGVSGVRLGKVQSMRRFGPDDEPPYAESLPLVTIREGTPRIATADVDRMQLFIRRQLQLDTLILVREYN
ncbi:putative hydrophobic protein (TIGR00271 family) [Lewinella marina]|uniref:DUF389 domain-containing protein n=1 Tax=Neolewinella marina TaxID=438751 RepID=A0A2G0CJD6_9BACT|nr:DUF389 domain-containing protein [Neolewinella marina]NJB84757.1 putative hydrophobic protein (TIGR00271 family) [Neolewinella marina]PHL00084.1 hypothetical protein CGL56_03320 [Neolewinella marina]